MLYLISCAHDNKIQHLLQGCLKAYSPFWKPIQATPQQLAQFLRFVAEGEQDKAEAMLKANLGLALQSGKVTDLSKRTFKHITAFQYAVWARDWHMWTMLLHYLSENDAALQLYALEQNGTEHERQFDLRILIDVLNVLEEQWDNWNDDQKNAHWIKQVGGMQLLLPAHVVNEYCRLDRAFDPSPDFTSGPLPRMRESRRKKDWYLSDCGKQYAFIRIHLGKVHEVRNVWENQLVSSFLEVDTFALQNLATPRERQFESLKSGLYRSKLLLGRMVG